MWIGARCCIDLGLAKYIAMDVFDSVFHNYLITLSVSGGVRPSSCVLNA